MIRRTLKDPKPPRGPVLTFDMEWAPDFAIDFVAQQLIRYGVRATWFVTHACAAVDRLRRFPGLFELGIHPNFIEGSTHGKTHSEVLRHCLAIVPEARSMRSHSLYQTMHLYVKILRETRIRRDSSIFMPYAASLSPVPFRWQGKTLARYPYCWEDDYELAQDKPRWNLGVLRKKCSGLQIVNFHPMLVYLNSADIKPYERFKSKTRYLHQSTEKVAKGYRHAGVGTQTFFMKILQSFGRPGVASRLSDLALPEKS